MNQHSPPPPPPQIPAEYRTEIESWGREATKWANRFLLLPWRFGPLPTLLSPPVSPPPQRTGGRPIRGISTHSRPRDGWTAADGGQRGTAQQF